MSYTQYNKSCSDYTNHEGDVNISHNHLKEIYYDSHSRSDRKNIIDNEITLIKGCITFFRTVAEKESLPKVIASAKAAVDEDEARIIEHKKHRPCF